MAKEAIRHYFSKSQSLYICLRVGKKEIVDGEMRTGEGKYAQFSPIGDGFGRFATSDPEVIQLMDERIEQVGDVFGPEEYQKRSIPAEKRNEILERELKTANDLLAKLRAEGKLKDK